MSESILSNSLIPGMIALKHKASGKVTQHFPVDAREILASQPGQYVMEQNGAVEAARMNAQPLQLAAATAAAQIVGIEGQVMVAMSAEEAEAWKARMAETAGVEKPAEPAEKPAEDKPADKPATTAAAKSAPTK